MATYTATTTDADLTYMEFDFDGWLYEFYVELEED